MFLSGHASNLNTPEHLEASNPQIHHCCMFFVFLGGSLTLRVGGFQMAVSTEPHQKNKDLFFALDKGLIPRGVR